MEFDLLAQSMRRARIASVPLDERSVFVLTERLRKLEARIEAQLIAIDERFRAHERARMAEVQNRRREAEAELHQAATPVIQGITVDQVKRAVCAVMNVSEAMLAGERRDALVVKARMCAYYLCWRHCGASMPAIGRRLGGRDHTTVLSGRDKIINLLAAGNEEIKEVVAKIEALLNAEPQQA